MASIQKGTGMMLRKAWNWLIHDDNWLAVIGIISFACIIGLLVYALATYTPLTEGEVIYKEYRPAHSEYSPIYIHVNGKQQTIPHFRMVGDKWMVTVKNGEDTDMWYVTENYYDSVKIGDWISK